MSARKNAGTEKRTKKQTFLRTDFRILAKVWRLEPTYIVMLIVHALVFAFVDSLAVYFRNTVFNELDTGGSFETVARYILLLAAFYLIVFIPSFLYDLVLMPILNRRLQMRIHREIYRKAQSMDLCCFDDPDFYNQFVWAMRESASRAVSVVNCVGNIVNRLLSAAAISGLLFTINPWVGGIMLVGIFLATAGVDIIGNRLWFRAAKERNPLWRKEGYIDRTFNQPDWAKEMRVGRNAGTLTGELEENSLRMQESVRRYGVKFILLYGVGYRFIERGTYYATILIMISELAAGNVRLGGFAAAVTSLWMLETIMQALSDSLAELPQHAPYLDRYFAFLDHENTMVPGRDHVPPFESLTLDHVSFSYAPVRTEAERALNESIRAAEIKRSGVDPGEDEGTADNGKIVLSDVSLTIRRGEKLAIVGCNGAGKTTLIKLLMRLYDPTGGRILYNGQDIRDFDPDEYRQHIGAVFQDYRLFASSLAENVLGGPYDGAPETEAAVRSALDAAAFTDRLAALPDGLATPLSREIDEKGVNLSGGEAQKVAIARVFVRSYDLIFMDEPSSALDPVAEYELNHSILNAADSRDRTVIFISHRLSTTRFADRILLFDGGTLRESGSHDELMRIPDGCYAAMFSLQAENYRKGEDI